MYRLMMEDCEGEQTAADAAIGADEVHGDDDGDVAVADDMLVAEEPEVVAEARRQPLSNIVVEFLYPHPPASYDKDIRMLLKFDF